MADNVDNLTGAECAAVLLMSMGEKEAARVMKHLDVRDVQRVGTAMTDLKGMSRTRANLVLKRFAVDLHEQTSFGVGAEEYVRKVLVEALGENDANDIVDRIMLGRNGKGLEALKWMESKDVASIVAQEHPQIIALVLANLKPGQAAEVVGYLPENIRGDVVMRVATMGGVQPHALHELDQIMQGQFSGDASRVRAEPVGGLKVAADILNNMDTTGEGELLGSIREVDQDLGDRIEELMFTFADLIEIDDRSMQVLLRKVPQQKLVVALKGSNEKMRERFFKNMSQRAAEILRDDLAVSMPVRVSEVDAAQKEILGEARRLADSGEIILGGTEQMI